ncbi:hypothetical protein AB0M46_48160 [Dactylosporangium sp. NPDC051485]|uniref:hypothetical protein n=1 Tax=Dactylosporangium sp. NPDC051485 TaxID=3154846 RepID=UPI003446F655
MNTWAFETYADGEDADTAFDTARRDAAREHGHRYSGPIADKDPFVIITDTITDLDAAEALAGTLMEHDDPRTADRCGPAGAIPVRQPTRTVHVDDLTGSGTTYLLGPAELDRIAGTLTLTFTVRTSPTRTGIHSQPDGWLFVGWASCRAAPSRTVGRRRSGTPAPPTAGPVPNDAAAATWHPDRATDQDASRVVTPFHSSPATVTP